MNLLWLESAIPMNTMTAWVVPEGIKSVQPCFQVKGTQSLRSYHFRLYDDALAEMIGLHIIQNSPAKLALNSTFKSSLRQAVTGGCMRRSLRLHRLKNDI